MKEKRQFFILLMFLVATSVFCVEEGEKMKDQEIATAAGGESVWSYPRPPRVEATTKRILVIFGGVTIAETTRAKRVLETGHPPVYYIPQEDIRMEYLSPNARTTICEWKGKSIYYDIDAGDKSERSVAWSYPDPTAAYEEIKDYVAFYPRPMDACFVDGERVIPEPGQYYGGWITSDILGPFPDEP